MQNKKITLPERPVREDGGKAKLFVPSKVATGFSEEEVEGIEETEIAAEISLPVDGGWGWVILFGSFYNTFLIDGVFFTFGALLQDIANDLHVQTTLIALVNSTAIALYFMSGPLVSALINRFGFRVCSMLGSILLCISFLIAYFTYDYATFLMSYGIVAGFGACLIFMPATIIVGFYFERYRSFALTVSGSGSSIGIMIMFSVNSYLVNFVGWRITTLLHAGCLGTTFFMALTYRPLLSLTVTRTADEPTRTVTYLPSLSRTRDLQDSSARTIDSKKMPSATERLFSVVSNIHFPTAAAVIEEGVQQQATQSKAGPSSAAVSKLTLTARNPSGAVGRRQLNRVQSIIDDRSNIQWATKDQKENKSYVTLQITPPPTGETPKKRSCWYKLCHWEKHVAESRPMYRDDVFYQGKIENLPIYQKSVINTPEEERTGFEYQMAVSRAVTVADLTDHEGICTTAFRRILATMLDPKLLRRVSFLLLSLSGFIAYIGLLIPYVFLPDRNKIQGIEDKHCNMFVSVIGFANLIGRIISGGLSSKYSPLKLYQNASALAGIATMAFNFSFDVYYQYGCCIFFGVFIAFLSTLRSILLVHLYGLEMLTNATGMILLFQGCGTLISTPLSSIIKDLFGYTISFYVAGAVLILSSIVVIPIDNLSKKEEADAVNVDTVVDNKK